MKKIITLCALAVLGVSSMSASLTLNGKTYEVDTISQREVGPGIVYTRYRIPDYPLNINTLEMDLNNEYNRVETTQPLDMVGKNETLAAAYTRHALEGKKPIAGANASFWCVPGHGAGWAFMLGTNFGASVYNGKIYTETNTHNTLAFGGPSNTGGFAIDYSKRLWCDHLSWYGEVKCSRWSKPLEIIQFNRACFEGELAVFTQDFGKTRKMVTESTNDNIYLNLDPGEKWAVNKDMTCTVQAISLNKGEETVGDYDLCLTGNGDYKQYLSQLQVGDKITLNHYWFRMSDKARPEVEQMMEGNALVIENGEITPYCYEEGYCAQVYSRTVYGASQDGRKLFIIVIDLSTNEDGYSAGCPTSVACEILKTRGCWRATNFDAGGSAQMLVDGKVINRTTEGTPRAVSTSWLLYSTAPGNDKVVTRIEFDQFNVKMPINASFTPKILGYNQYGELVDNDFKEFTLSCDPDLGVASGTKFDASATPTSGILTATYNGYKVTKKITTCNAEMAIKVKPNLIIDGAMEYPIEVTSKIDRATYFYDPAKLDWKVEDPTIATIENGVLKGLKEGTTKISCSLGDFTDETQVSVQIAEHRFMPVAWDGWTLKAVGAKELALNAEGVLSMNYTSGRGPYIKMTKDVTLYSLPRNITLEFTPSIPIDYIQVDLRSASMTNNNYIAFGKDNGGFAAGTKYTIDFNLSNIFDLDDMLTYPISLKEITFYPPATGVVKGAQNITIHAMNVEYANPSGVDKVIENTESSIKVYPNPVIDGSMTVCSSDDEAMVEIYNTSGSLVKKTIAPTNGGSATIEVSDLAPGIYFVKIDTTSESKTQKIIIR